MVRPRISPHRRVRVLVGFSSSEVRVGAAHHRADRVLLRRRRVQPAARLPTETGAAGGEPLADRVPSRPVRAVRSSPKLILAVNGSGVAPGVPLSGGKTWSQRGGFKKWRLRLQNCGRVDPGHGAPRHGDVPLGAWLPTLAAGVLARRAGRCIHGWVAGGCRWTSNSVCLEPL